MSDESPYSKGHIAGWNYCNAACNDGMCMTDTNPYPESSPEYEQFADGFIAGVEYWEETS